MPRFYCTFGSGQPNAGHVLPIIAEDETQARAYMFETYGHTWCTSYTESAWEAWKKRAPSYIPIEVELPTVDASNFMKREENPNEV